ncbi:hypothetical protein HQ571_03510 [Candidatus Kuenenbacteria bacterium]|nr:hypothetical protein [Candidatus Kuenenbacteria bacterium]
MSKENFDEFQPQEAKGDDLLALQLESHLRWFTPTGWVEPLSKPMHLPYIEVEEFQAMRKAFDEGKLKEHLKGCKGVLTYPAVIEGVEAYFQKIST